MKFESKNYEVKNSNANTIKMYGLYRVYGGHNFTGIVAKTEQEIINYLDKTYRNRTTFEDGTVFDNPAWNKDAWIIKPMEFTLI
jgi:hypothetical protein